MIIDFIARLVALIILTPISAFIVLLFVRLLKYLTDKTRY